MTVAFRAAGVRVEFGGLTAVADADIDIAAGEIHGVIGPNGAGKTTFFNAISGLVPISAGEVWLADRNITALPAHARAHLGIRRTFQSVQLIRTFTVLENVLLGLETERSVSLPKLLAAAGTKAERLRQDRVIEMLDYLDITNLLWKRPAELTFQQQRYVEIARALVSVPKILLLDEPAAGLSPVEVEDLDRLLRKLRDDFNLSIILVEHVLSLVLTISDRISVLDRGRIIARGSPEEISGNAEVKTAYLGVA